MKYRRHNEQKVHGNVLKRYVEEAKKVRQLVVLMLEDEDADAGSKTSIRV